MTCWPTRTVSESPICATRMAAVTRSSCRSEISAAASDEMIFARTTSPATPSTVISSMPLTTCAAVITPPLLSGALDPVPPDLQDVPPIGDLERPGRVLLHEHHRETAPRQRDDRLEHIVDEARGEPERRLVQHHHLGLHHEGASHREHLLL